MPVKMQAIPAAIRMIFSITNANNIKGSPVPME
jgi:hypothetical protein